LDNKAEDNNNRT